MIRLAIVLLAAAAAGHSQIETSTKPAAPVKPAAATSKPAVAAPKPAATKPATAERPVSRAKPGATRVPPSLDIPKLPEVKVIMASPQAVKQPSADTSLGLKPAAPREFAPLGVVQYALPNGMRVILHEDRRLPWVAGNLRLGTGSALDPPLKAGLAEMLMLTILSGGGRGSSRESQRNRIDSTGAILQADTGERASSLVFRSLSGSFDEVLGMVAAGVTDPSFDEDALEESRAQLRNRVGGRNNNIEQIVSRESHAAVLGKWAPPRLEYSTLANVGQEDLRLFHRQQNVPSAATLILTGDFSASEIRPRLETLFGGWKGAPGTKTPAPEAPSPSGLRFAEAVRAQAAAFALARTGPALGSPEYAPAAILAELLSGGSDSRLSELAKEKQSWTLKTVSNLDAAPGRPTIFTIRGVCDTPYPVDAMAGILDEAAEVRRGEVTDAAIEKARLTAMSIWAAQFPNALSRLTFDEGARRDGLPPDFAALHYKALSAVRKADVARVAETLLEPKSLHVTVVGNATLMNRPLAEFRSPVQPVDMTIPVAQPLEIRADPAAKERGQAWLAKVQAALGGAEKLSAVKDLEIMSKGTHLNTPLQLTDRWMAPGTIRQDQESQVGIVSAFYNGEIGWVGSVGRVAALSPAMLMQLRGEMLRVLPLLAMSGRDSARTVSHGGSNVLLITHTDGSAVRIYIDETTNLPARLVYQSVNAARLPAMAEETWSEWKESGGIKFPGKIVLRMDGRRAGEMTVESVKVNSGLKLADIERKP